jgi:signal transduction histidine kinase
LTLVAVAMGGVGAFALRNAVRGKDEVIDQHSRNLLLVERLSLLNERMARKGNSAIVTRDPRFRAERDLAGEEMVATLEQLHVRLAGDPHLRTRLVNIENTASRLRREMDVLLREHYLGASDAQTKTKLEQTIQPLRDSLDDQLERLLEKEIQALEQAKHSAKENTERMLSLLYATLGSGILILIGIGSLLNRTVRLVQIQREQLSASAQFQQQLISIVGHDIRSPVAAIVVSTETLRRRIQAADQSALQRINRSARRIDRLSTLLADFTRAQARNGLHIEREPCDLHMVASRIVQDEQRKSEQEVRLEHRSHGDGAGAWDPERVEQILSYLIDNALRYGDNRQPIVVTTRGFTNHVELEVHNGGDPIPASMLPELFHPFRHDLRESNTVKFSAGLALFLVQALAQAHGGNVSVTSTIEDGTRFQVFLPRTAPQKTPGRASEGSRALEIPARTLT